MVMNPSIRTVGTSDNYFALKQRSPLLRGLRCLEILQKSPSTIAEVARVLEVNRSTVHRLLRELELAGYITKEPGSRRYSVVDREPTDPGKSVKDRTVQRSESEWGEVLHRELSEVRDIAGESTMFSVPARDRMLYASFYPSDHPISVQELIGSTRPMHASAVGKAYLSGLDPQVLDVVLGRLNYSDGTELAAKGPFQLRDMLSEVYVRQYAVDHGETFEGLSCVAVPVFVNGVTLVGAAGITGPTHRFPTGRVEEYGDLLVKRVRNLKLN